MGLLLPARLHDQRSSMQVPGVARGRRAEQKLRRLPSSKWALRSGHRDLLPVWCSKSMPYQPEIGSEQDAGIISIVRQAGEISRLDLMRRSGLSRTTVTGRLSSLLEKGILEEVGVGLSNGGRPPTLVRFAKEAGYVVGIDLGATSLDIAVTNLNAEPLVHAAQEMYVRDGPDLIMPRIKEAVEAVLDGAGINRSSVKAIGMGVPGPVEFSTGRPVTPPLMPGWHLYPVRDYLESAFSRPVYVDNDVNIMALGERWSGIGQDVDNFIFVKIGTGIGCGIVCQGKVYRGADGSAGDIGHIAVGDDATVCRCGNTGCLEALAGGWAIGRNAERIAREGISETLARRLQEAGSLTAVDVSAALSEGDPVVIEVVRQSGQAIGRVLAGLVNFYNPSLIVIGGGVAKVGDLLLAAVRETVYRRSLPLATRHIVVRASALGDDAGIVGAAAMVLGNLYRLTPIGAAAADSHRGRTR